MWGIAACFKWFLNIHFSREIEKFVPESFQHYFETNAEHSWLHLPEHKYRVKRTITRTSMVKVN